MAEQSKPRTRKPRASTAKTPASAAAPTGSSSSQAPVIDPDTLKAILTWLNVIDNWNIAGYQNKLPRWVYVIIGFLILT